MNDSKDNMVPEKVFGKWPTKRKFTENVCTRTQSLDVAEAPNENALLGKLSSNKDLNDDEISYDFFWISYFWY